MEVPDNTEVTCVSCGEVYEIKYTKEHSTEPGRRICCDCIDGEL